MGRWGDEGMREAGGERITNAQFPIPNCQFSVPNAYKIKNAPEYSLGLNQGASTITLY
jgi:hypothetical protein